MNSVGNLFFCIVFVLFLTFKNLISISSARREHDNNPSVLLDLLYYVNYIIEFFFILWYLLMSNWYYSFALFIIGSIVSSFLSGGIDRKKHGYPFSGILVPPVNLLAEEEVAKIGIVGCIITLIIMSLFVRSFGIPVL